MVFLGIRGRTFPKLDLADLASIPDRPLVEAGWTVVPERRKRQREGGASSVSAVMVLADMFAPWGFADGLIRRSA